MDENCSETMRPQATNLRQQGLAENSPNKKERRTKWYSHRGQGRLQHEIWFQTADDDYIYLLSLLSSPGMSVAVIKAGLKRIVISFSPAPTSVYLL